jgi:predicted nucleotidyltransferase
VFGSVARGEDREDSDVDLLVTLPEGIDLFELVAVEQQLEDLLGVPVNVVDDRSRGAVFDRALREAVAL